MKVYGELHPKSDVDRLYIKRKERGTGLIGVERQKRGFYVANSEENLIKRVAAADTINTEDNVTSGEFEKRKHKNLNKTDAKKKNG